MYLISWKQIMAERFFLDMDADLNQDKFSCFNEERIIKEILKHLNVKNKYCVDIGASDGLSMSNTFSLFRSGWRGLAVEGNGENFAKMALFYGFVVKLSWVDFCKLIVTPENVNSIFLASQVPKDFGLLSLDIDSYEYFVLEQILRDYRPSIICVEINENIPPPLKFTVNWNPNFSYSGDEFFGQSISQLNCLCEQYGYELVDLEYNNAFLIPKEINPFASLTPEEAYQAGYIGRADRLEKLPWRKDSLIEKIHELPPQDALVFLNNLFSKYQGQYTLKI